MASQIFGPILPLLLDSRNVDDLVRAIQSRIFIESEGKLNDFTPASPLAAISEGQGFAQAELLYYLNSLPEAVSLQWLRALGVQRRIGSRAYAEVTFYRVPGYTRPVTIPPEAAVFATGGQKYLLMEQVRMTEDSATVRVMSERWGQVYNVGQGEITRLDRNILGLDFVTNLTPATGGTDLESVDEMKLRAFELLGRRNLTSRADYESETSLLAPEAAIVKVLPYGERFEDDARGIFIVAGGSDGSEVAPATREALLTSLRNRSPLDVKLYLTAPKILPVDVSVEVYWDPRVTTTFTDTMAAEIKERLSVLISPSGATLGQPLQFSTVHKDILGLPYAVDVPNLTIRELALDPDIQGGTDEICGRFIGQAIDEETCLYSYNQSMDRESGGSISPSSNISAFRLYRAVVTLTSVVDFTTLSYTYDQQYEIV
jgi:hypothetical protein